MGGVTGILFLVCAGCVGIFLYAMKRQRKQIEELEQYCEEVLQETATLDLRDNEEEDSVFLKIKYMISPYFSEKRINCSKKIRRRQKG